MFEFLGLPESAKIDMKVDKKQFYDQGDLNVSERKVFVNDIEKITWAFSITHDTTNIKPLIDETKDYSEIQVVDVQLRNTDHVERISDVIMSSFQYMVFLLLRYNSQIMVVMAHKRINHNDKNRLITGELLFSEWLSEDSKLLETFNVKLMRTTNLFDLYADEFAALTRINLSTKGFSELDGTPEKLKELLDEIEKIDAAILSLRSQIKKEDHFSRQIKLNNEINDLLKKRNSFLDGKSL